MREDAERAQPVVDRDHDDAAARERGAIEYRAAADHETAAVQPDGDRPAVARAACSRPDVEVEAVLARRQGGGRRRARIEACIAGNLHAARTETRGIPHALPRRG